MMNEKRIDKDRKIYILNTSFEKNQSVIYIVRRDAKRISALMAYSFQVCYSFGDVFYLIIKSMCSNNSCR